MIGDVLISTIICNNLKKQFPHSQIDYLIYPHTQPVTDNNPYIDNVILFPEAAQKSKIKFLKFIWTIQQRRYDVVLDAYSKLESCLTTMFSGAERRIGYDGKGVPFSYNEKVLYLEEPATFKGLAIERREQLILAVTEAEIDPYPKLFLTSEETDLAYQTITSHNIDLQKESLVMISLLGSDKSKTYPLSYMAEILNQVAKQPNVKVILNYMPKQEAEAKVILKYCSDATQAKIILDVLPHDLRSLMALLSHCSIIVGNDGGAINIAKALAKPTFTIFAPWIEKKSWSIFEDGVFHKAVHLNDYKPEVIQSKCRKELQKDYERHYRIFEPNYFIAELDTFLYHHLNR
jgi:heptosyltransferase-2